MGKVGLLASFRNASMRILRAVPEKTQAQAMVDFMRQDTQLTMSTQGDFVERAESTPRTKQAQLSVPQMPRPISLTVTLSPRSQNHLALLKPCLAYSGDIRSGMISVTITGRFQDWLMGLSAASLKQAYFDAVFLASDKEFRAVDKVKLTKEAGIDESWSRDDLISLNAICRNSQIQLQEYQTFSDVKKSTTWTKEELKLEYLAATAKGNLTSDYKHFNAAVQFERKARAKDLMILQEDKVSVAALKRLELMFNNQK